LNTLLEDHEVNEFERLIERIEPEKVRTMIGESKEEQSAGPQEKAGPSPLDLEPIAEEISFDEFMKVDLRVGRVVKAELVDGADKLLRLELDLGGQIRTVLAGIRQAYEPDQLVGRLMIVAANLAPRKMKFGLSEGMILAAGAGGKDVYALSIDEGAKPGERVH
jgi:methionyl-tRNA synthetase